jgi:hypothetical protein
MGLQIGFYAIEKDHDTLLQLAEEKGLVALPELIPVNAKPKAYAPTEFKLPDGQSRFYLLASDIQVDDSFYGRTQYDPSQAVLLNRTVPIIEFTPSTRKKDEVEPGRLYIAMEKDDRYYSIVRKKYDLLAREVRKWARTDQFRFYVGPHTAELTKDGTVDLMWGRHRLKPKTE